MEFDDWQPDASCRVPDFPLEWTGESDGVYMESGFCPYMEIAYVPMLVPIYGAPDPSQVGTESMRAAQSVAIMEEEEAHFTRRRVKAAGARRRAVRPVEVSGILVLNELTLKSENQLGLCFHLGPDEPVCLDQSTEKAMDRWHAECAMPSWSALSPMAADADRCVGSVIKNTFLHIAPPPAALREQEWGKRRSRSVPRDFGSAKSLWHATSHAFKLAQSGSSVQQATLQPRHSQTELCGDTCGDTCGDEPGGAPVLPDCVW